MTTYELENIIEMASLLGYGMAKGEISFETEEGYPMMDAFKEVVEEWAEEFEKEFKGEDDYILEISKFAERKFYEENWIVEPNRNDFNETTPVFFHTL